MGKTAFIFPGQGAQKPGMGKEFYENSPLAKAIFDRAEAETGLDMKALCFEENDKLNITEYTQICLVTTSVAMMEVLKAKGIHADIAAGLSLGEYAALVAAGAMDFADAAKAVRKRGIFMQEEVPAGEGAMAAVLGMDAQAIEENIKDFQKVQIANYNCPGQIVISGETKEVEKAADKLKEAGAKRCIMLNVSGPFHSQMLQGAGEKLSKELDQIEIHDLAIPYVANVNGEIVSDSSKIKPYLVQQVSSSVRWEQSVRNMIEWGVDTFIEIGPGKTLAGFNRKIDREIKTFNVETLADIDKILAEV